MNLEDDGRGCKSNTILIMNQFDYINHEGMSRVSQATPLIHSFPLSTLHYRHTFHKYKCIRSTKAYSHSSAKRNRFSSASAIAKFEHYTSIKMSFENLFSSFRLVYTSIEKDDKIAKAVLAKALRNDPVAYGQAIEILLEPPTSQIISNTIDWAVNELLGVMIGLPSPDPADDLIPIGHLSLSAYNSNRHHRSCRLSIMIYSPHQGKGYGTEAINWALDWAFKIAGMHSV